MFHKISKTWRWYKRFFKSLGKYPTFRREVWPKFWKIINDEDLYGVIVSTIATVIVGIILVCCLIERIAKHAPIAPWIILIFLAVAVWKTVANLMRLHAPLKTASEYAVEQTREARGDYVAPSDNDDDGEDADDRDIRHAVRRRRGSY